jgi:folylpolyglutamate synthase/dihydropteroate synthase
VALAEALRDLRPLLAGGRQDPPVPLTLVLGIMADKDVPSVVTALGGGPDGALQDALVVCTQVALDRALPAAGLAAAWQAEHPTSRPVVEPEVDAAVDWALRNAPGPVVVAGSLYLVGHVRGRLLPDPTLVDPPHVPAGGSHAGLGDSHPRPARSQPVPRRSQPVLGGPHPGVAAADR